MLRGALKQNLNGPTLETIEHEVNLDAIPKEFDSRKEWPQCPSIREIQDQGVCGADWVRTRAVGSLHMKGPLSD